MRAVLCCAVSAAHCAALQFDYSLEILSAFIDNLTAPVLSCNLQVRPGSAPLGWLLYCTQLAPVPVMCVPRRAQPSKEESSGRALLAQGFQIRLPTAPALCAAQVQGQPLLEGRVLPYVVKQLPVSGVKVGIIGLTAPETSEVSKAGEAGARQAKHSMAWLV